MKLSALIKAANLALTSWGDLDIYLDISEDGGDMFLAKELLGERGDFGEMEHIVISAYDTQPILKLVK